MNQTEQVFRQALQTEAANPNVGPISPYGKVMNSVLYSNLGWAVITILAVFAILYFINPPFIQCHKKENEMTRPPPNLYIVLGISALSGILVLVSCKFM